MSRNRTSSGRSLVAPGGVALYGTPGSMSWNDYWGSASYWVDYTCTVMLPINSHRTLLNVV